MMTCSPSQVHFSKIPLMTFIYFSDMITFEFFSFNFWSNKSCFYNELLHSFIFIYCSGGVSIIVFAASKYAQGKQKPFTVIPPSTQMVWPVMYEAAGRHRNATKEETSFGSPARPRGVWQLTASKNFSLLIYCKEDNIQIKNYQWSPNTPWKITDFLKILNV